MVVGCVFHFHPLRGKNGSIGSLNSEKLVNEVEIWLRQEVGNSSASTLPISSGSISVLEVFEIFQKSGLLFSELKILGGRLVWGKSE